MLLSITTDHHVLNVCTCCLVWIWFSHSSWADCCSCWDSSSRSSGQLILHCSWSFSSATCKMFTWHHQGFEDKYIDWVVIGIHPTTLLPSSPGPFPAFQCCMLRLGMRLPLHQCVYMYMYIVSYNLTFFLSCSRLDFSCVALVQNVHE